MTDEEMNCDVFTQAFAIVSEVEEFMRQHQLDHPVILPNADLVFQVGLFHNLYYFGNSMCHVSYDKMIK